MGAMQSQALEMIRHDFISETIDGREYWMCNDIKSSPSVLKNPSRRESQKMVFFLSVDCLFKEGHPVKHWFYGHFYNSHTAYISDTCFSMLSIMELCELGIGI
jgi:hypothetical protein